MHNAYVRVESTINTYYPLSVQCDDCDFTVIADDMAEAHDFRDKHIYATCPHENTTTYETRWSQGDEKVCDDCERTYNYVEMAWVS